MRKRFNVNLEGAEEDPASDDNQPQAERPYRSDINEEQANDLRSYRQLREQYARYAFFFAVGCVAFWMIIVVWLGWASYYKARPVFSDRVMIAITTATCVNLFAAFLGVIRGLFPTSGNGGS
ncbi:hypothetical protein [Vreelandella massiliensis]|uniref:hypothetical protein n=1 Tax=Vreelandella massiliensis TaxID=1816686 RepID=UPI00096A51A4|nr:hypothetical protein [Halomonas massiliensis]